MGANVIASGRSPSMDRITTRRARNAGVGVAEGAGVSVGGGVTEALGVSVGGWIATAVSVNIGGCICVAVGGVKGDPLFENWQASRIKIEMRE